MNETRAADRPLGAPTKATVLVVDDEDLIRWTLRQRLEDAGYDVIEASSGSEARGRFGDRIDLVLLDYQLGDTDGITVLRELKDAAPEVPVILLTAFSTVERAVEALQSGAYHFVTKPFEAAEVVGLVGRALEATGLMREVRRLRAERADQGSVDRIVGRSPSIKEAKQLILRFARSPASTVLITGESGTGKDLAAHAVHAASDRASGPFMNITTSALPEQLLESELFGHERGAFTDARQRKLGLLEQADGGTVFLDEIGEMTPGLQAKLLRFLEEHTFRRVGGTDEINPNVRVIAATNRELDQMVREGTFREDLFYRLSVLSVRLPPLREREGDMPLLASFFVDSFSRDFKKHVRTIDPRTIALLERHPWPGNVRELRNALERAVLLCEGETLFPDDLSFLASPSRDNAPAFELPPGGVDLAALERDLVVQALERTRGNRTRAAKLLGMNRDQIRYRIEKFGLKSEPNA